MNRILFPFGFPWPTAMYLTLLVITATIYMVFMNYVLAGSIVLMVGYVAPGARRRVETGSGGQTRSGLGLILKVVRDWLPAILGLTITAGIAPLLFLQILYKRQFYTANLLIFNHHAGYRAHGSHYLLYSIKSHALAGKWAVLRGPVAIAAFACFALHGLGPDLSSGASTKKLCTPGVRLGQLFFSATPRSGPGWGTGSRHRSRRWQLWWRGSSTGAGVSMTR